MRRAWVVAGLCALAGAGCRRHASEPLRRLPPPTETSAAEPPLPAGVAGLVVAGRTGVRVLGPDGHLQRRLSSTPASDPRWLPGRQALVFLGDANGATRDVRRVSLAGGDETVLARLAPLSPCKAGGRDHRLGTQGPDDFVVDAKRNVACLQLLDRNQNMADVDVSLQIDLGTGALRRHVVLAPDCELAAGLTAGDAFTCDDGVAPPVDEFPGLQRPDEWDIRAVSPSRRWVVLQGNEVDTDYVHFDALLLDAQSHLLYPIKPGPWPPALDRARLAHLDELHRRTAGIVGESDVRWLPGDLLIVDTLLVLPGLRVIDLGGEVIR
jgi:hypothetical protein